jgi:hypothetical protein
MGVTIPTSYDVALDSMPPVSVASVGPVGPVSISGIPDTFHIDVDKLPAIHIGVDTLPKIQLGVDPVELGVSIKEIPSIRGHLPADFTVGFSMMGIELFAIRLCGEAQMITEPFHANPCEHCGQVHQRLPGTAIAAAGHVENR